MDLVFAVLVVKVAAASVLAFVAAGLIHIAVEARRPYQPIRLDLEQRRTRVRILRIVAELPAESRKEIRRDLDRAA